MKTPTPTTAVIVAADTIHPSHLYNTAKLPDCQIATGQHFLSLLLCLDPSVPPLSYSEMTQCQINASFHDVYLLIVRIMIFPIVESPSSFGTPVHVSIYHSPEQETCQDLAAMAVGPPLCPPWVQLRLP